MIWGENPLFSETPNSCSSSGQALANALDTSPERIVWAHGASDVILRTAMAATKRCAGGDGWRLEFLADFLPPKKPDTPEN